MTEIPVVIGAFGTIPKRLVKGRDVFGIREQEETIESTALRLARMKSPGDLRRLAVTQTSVQIHLVMLV